MRKLVQNASLSQNAAEYRLRRGLGGIRKIVHTSGQILASSLNRHKTGFVQ